MGTDFVGKGRDMQQMVDAQNGEGGAEIGSFRSRKAGTERMKRPAKIVAHPPILISVKFKRTTLDRRMPSKERIFTEYRFEFVDATDLLDSCESARRHLSD
jgi:hypothetical protein